VCAPIRVEPALQTEQVRTPRVGRRVAKALKAGRQRASTFRPMRNLGIVDAGAPAVHVYRAIERLGEN